MDSDSDTVVSDFECTLGDCYINISSLQEMCIKNAEAINSLMEQSKYMLCQLEELKRASSQTSNTFASSLVVDKKSIEIIPSAEYKPRYKMPQSVKEVFDKVFETNRYPTALQKRYLEQFSGLSSKSVNCWFTNRRKRQKTVR